MRFLTDQDVFAKTVSLLRDGGHDVVTASESGLHQAADQTLLHTAQQESRILITRDRDYGELIFLTGHSSGVIYLRMEIKLVDAVHRELERVLQLYSEVELLAMFCVVEPGRHRIRREKTS